MTTSWHGNAFHITDPLWGESTSTQRCVVALLAWRSCWTYSWVADDLKHFNHCELVTQLSKINLGQHWHKKWLAAWRHQAITWTNVDLSSEGRQEVTFTSDTLSINYYNDIKIYINWNEWSPKRSRCNVCCSIFQSSKNIASGTHLLPHVHRAPLS